MLVAYSKAWYVVNSNIAAGSDSVRGNSAAMEGRRRKQSGQEAIVLLVGECLKQGARAHGVRAVKMRPFLGNLLSKCCTDLRLQDARSVKLKACNNIPSMHLISLQDECLKKIGKHRSTAVDISEPLL